MSRASQNRLAHAKSPYLLQHASNPVDWYEWSDDAFERAKAENKPIFLSVGYSACHWCHVLAHESFENEAIAKVMNENFVNIKVDREERPDVDRLYMIFLLSTKGSGGWPMSVWLTPELAPFFAGTYFPSHAFKTLCEKIAQAWAADATKVREHSESIVQTLQSAAKEAVARTPIGLFDFDAMSKRVYDHWSSAFDAVSGGFGGAPKFPSPSLTFHPLLRHAYYAAAEEKRTAVHMVARTLLAIHRGGINDHVGKGIARYAVDAEWRLPHFEKMLYDQAQLATSAIECALSVENAQVRDELHRMAADIIGYARRDLWSPRPARGGGAFCASEDADSLPSEGSTHTQEGAFYVWKKSEIDNILGYNAGLFCEHFGVKEEGNIDPAHDAHGELTNQNQLYISVPLSGLAAKYGITASQARETVQDCLDKLRTHRAAHRPRPHRDDKIVASWNGYMLSALALAASALPADLAFPDDGAGVAASSLNMAEDLAGFAKSRLWDASARELCRSWKEGRGPLGVCEDYAALIAGFLDLYEATGKEEYALFAKDLQARQDELFWDAEGGGYFASRADDAHMRVRLKESQDGAEPCATSLSVANLHRLAHLFTADEDAAQLRDRAEKTVAAQQTVLDRAPYTLGMAVTAAQMGVRGMKQIIVTGTEADAGTADVLRAIRSSRFVPNRSLILIDPTNPPRGLAQHNEVVHSLVERLARKKDELGALELPEVRICEGRVCGEPLRGSELTNLVL